MKGLAEILKHNMQIAPLNELMPFIKHYLFIESEKDCVKKLRLFSDGCTGMVFCFRNRLVFQSRQMNNLNYLPYSFIYGQIDEYKDLYLFNKAALIIVVFQPYGLNRLLGIPANETGDKIIPAEDVFGSKGSLLYEKLLYQPHLENKLILLNTFFLRLIANQVSSNQKLVQASLDFITKNRGAVTIKQLTQHIGYSERHIERAFRECIGITPKRFSNIVKVHAFLKTVVYKSKQNNITRFCYEAGYFDQSHLIRQFKIHTGITPTGYLNDTTKLAINFMEFNSANLPMSDLYNLSK